MLDMFDYGELKCSRGTTGKFAGIGFLVECGFFGLVLKIVLKCMCIELGEDFFNLNFTTRVVKSVHVLFTLVLAIYSTNDDDFSTKIWSKCGFTGEEYFFLNLNKSCSKFA